MVGTGTAEEAHMQKQPGGGGGGSGDLSAKSSGGGQWGWPSPRIMRGYYHAHPRRGMYLRGAQAYFHAGPRGFGIPHQGYYSQRKPRPQWRNPRPPQYPVTPVETLMAFQAPWPNQPPPQPPAEEQTEEPPPKKKKRTTNGTARPWDKEAAEKALAMEAECQKNAGANAIVIRFPDPELSKEAVQKLHPTIENVHFQAPCGARYCFVTLAEDANVEKVMTDIRKIKFGVGHLIAEKKVQKTEENVGPENIDPFTLYVGNLPTNISTLEVKEKFPTATRIDVGYAQKMKYTRYAFVRYSTAEAALEAYKSSVNTVIASRSIILRFRRHKAPVGPPGEKPVPSIIEAKPGEKLTVGAKLKAKKEKAKADKALRDSKSKKKKVKGDGEDGSSEDEDVELENDDTDSEDLTEEDEDEEDDDDDDDDDEPDDEEDDEDDEEIEDDMDDPDDDEPDDDDPDDINAQDEDDDYMDDEDYKDICYQPRK